MIELSEILFICEKNFCLNERLHIFSINKIETDKYVYELLFECSKDYLQTAVISYSVKNLRKHHRKKKQQGQDFKLICKNSQTKKRNPQ